MVIQHTYGPFNPQELDRIIKWLEKNRIDFELNKDDESESSFKDNGPMNMLALTKLRTEVYLAQIFYVEVKFIHLDQQVLFEKNLLNEAEVIPKWLSRLTEPMQSVNMAQNKLSRKNIWSLILLVIWVGALLVSYFWNVMS